ncbi:sensor histidine kinase response regulator, Cache_1, PAS and PAS domain-containing [Citrifermentans bemidjiense Bem]|uniref:histidine kinase n=1 Tax=Citrifermentans bemidjiense (strain ATCC BAA-1014 / DSM 16622 / JCM 12645 / Bem) TaxID=404380 RepID=B5EBI9_CITBB|nr:PAS domain S-box protein [Citrifermentans bemidjiense]ACH37458.1 sensor histidine kinase response regulator, Cache_1, PAS and PAS domain-containing [Citrifermentans bemidjiense Bem]
MVQKFVKKGGLALLILAFTCLCTAIFYFSYQKAKQSAISRLNDEQFIHAKQAARGIEEYFVTWTGILTSLSRLDAIVAMDPAGKRQMEFFYDAHKDQIRSFTRMDEKGNILFAVPNREISGRNIAQQKHVQELIATKKPVVSDVFRTIQGYDAIALHVPVFEGSRFRGSIAIIVNFQSLAQRYIEVIRVGKTGYALVVSRDGTELYCPVPGHSGTNILAAAKESPSVLPMVRAMLKGESGTASYDFNTKDGASVKPVKKHAVYLPIHLGNTFWSIVVASSEQEILSSLASYRNRLALVFSGILFGGIIICILVLRALLIVREEDVRQQAEAELRASEQRYRYLFEQNPAPMLIYEKGTLQMLAVNDAFAIGYGYSNEEALALQLIDLYPEEEKPKITEVAAGLSGHTYVGEWHHRRKDGTVFPIFVTSHDMTYSGRTARVAVITDITDRKLMEKALEEEANFNRLLFDHSPDGIVIIDPKTARFINFNASVCRQLGYSREEFAQLRVFDVEAVETQEDTRRRIDGIVRDGRGDFETMQRTREGELRNVQVTAQILTIQDRPVYYCIWRDITEHKKLEEQLRQSQKMESVGRLAGGVAHDFNNMLGVIIGSADLCQHQIPADSPLQKYLDHILKAAKRSSDITRQLLAFSRKEVVSPKAVNLNSLIIDSEKMLCRLIGEDVKLTFKPSTGLWTVLIDPAQFDQILMNLSANSRDAMPNGGTLDIATGNVHLDAGYCRHHSDTVPGDYVKITVADTGTGMDRETKDHIFEPFFTTKGVGVGTGLGLATVYGIVTQNNGFINVYSELDQGSVFNIYLPRLLEDGAAEEEAEAAPPPKGTGTILLVEDEEMLLWTTTKILEEMGYTVQQAESPAKAIEICENGKQIDLVLTDVVMPGMNGREMVDRIRSTRPDIKVLFMSGYTADIVAQRGIVEEGMFYISKPLDAQQLHEKIVQTLAS